METALYLFGENFGTLAKEHLEAADALKKVLYSNKGHQVFREATLRRTQVVGVATGSAATQEGAKDDKFLATKPERGNQKEK